MLNKIVVRNVGLLRAFDTPSTPKLDKLTLIYGRNGRGKSTLTAVLRAARDGEADTVLGRQSLGNGGAPAKVVLTSTAGNIVFENGRWNTKSAPIEIFDTAFITDNVYAGELIELAHDRGLFSVIIGEAGVRLARHLERFNAYAKSSGAALKDAEAALADDVPTDLSNEEFFALGPVADHEKLLEAADRGVKAAQQGDKIASIQGLDVIAKPTLPEGLTDLLASTVADIDVSARHRLLEHFKRFELVKRGEAWISFGVEHIHDDACPFCGRADVDAEGMVTIYGQIFSEAYKAQLSAITTAAADVEAALGEDARTTLASTITSNAALVTKWREFVATGAELPDASGMTARLSAVHSKVKVLLDRKRASPVEPIQDAEALAGIAQELGSIDQLVTSYNSAVATINHTTSSAVAAVATTETAVRIRDNLKKRIARHDAGVQSRIDTYLRARRRDERARTIRTKIQKALKDANEASAKHYHSQVNHYLTRFGAAFSISEIKNSMQGNAGQADYGLKIKGETIARGRGRQTEAIPTFRNTLSAGDKTTLALAFFLAKLDQDTALDCKTLVIDDPLSSHDSHRRRETVNAVKDLCGRCLQVIVLSHDQFLLREVEQRCVGVPAVALQIEFTGGEEWSAVSPVDLDQLCRAGHARLVDEIIAFVDDRKGDPNHVVHNVRRVLETHYRRSFTAYFSRGQNLGQIVKDIAKAGATHPCHRDLARLDNCNDATCEEHHGDDALVVVKRDVDPDGLRIVARDALELIGARRP